MKRLHPESLLHIPLLRHALTDPIATLQPRAVDRGWFYDEVIPTNVSGFNPVGGRIMYANESKLALWLKRKNDSPRDLNLKDHLVQEALYVAHDYLHAWAYRAIQSLRPRLGLATAPITEKNFEDFVFCHLATEAVAVAGLDYWLLCQKDVNAHCSIGSGVRSLTVSYNESSIDEYRRFNKSFDVNTPKFFVALTKFYCSGDFIGFSRRDAIRSPLLLSWLEHEINYGYLQRFYTRSFVNHFSNRDLIGRLKDLHAPVSTTAPWKRDLMNDLGEMLWEKVKHDKIHRFGKQDSRALWKSPEHRRTDFRFVNLAKHADEEKMLRDLERAQDKTQDLGIHQFISRYRFDQFSEDEVRLIKSLIRSREVRHLNTFLKGRKKMKAVPSEPTDLMVLN